MMGCQKRLDMSGKEMSLENWKDIPEWEGWYQVSDQGRVRSVDRNVHYPDGSVRRFKGRLLSIRVGKVGYPAVDLCRQSRRKTYTVHSLIMLAFVGSRPEDMQVRHLDGDKDNCRLSNLQYGTPLENIMDRNVHDTVGRRVLRSDGKTYRMVKQACEDNGVSRAAIIKAAKGEGTCNGYYWEYMK